VDTLSDILGEDRMFSRRRLARDERGRGQARFRLSLQQRLPGQSLFRPTWPMARGHPQIPVDLPTFDEVVGPNVAAKDFNSFILDRFTESNSTSTRSMPK
jgi:undecaprenyl phosphate-alpha-L-ara4FN deformylase